MLSSSSSLEPQPQQLPKVVVFTRCCPSKSLSKEFVSFAPPPRTTLTPSSTIKISESQTSLRIANESSKSVIQTLNFAHCFGAKATNLDLASKFYPHIAHSIQQRGNLALFAYGQKSSGKSHSLFGSSEKGAIHHLLHLVLPLAADHQLQVSLSHFEVYRESVLDFFAVQKRFLRVTEDSASGLAYVKGLASPLVTSAEGAILLLDNAARLRKTRPQASVVFQLELASKATGELVSKISFIDLCASNERNMLSFSVEEKDASLVHLAKVIDSVRSQVPRQAIPFRDSILTWLFQDSFGGGGGGSGTPTQTLVLGCLSAENRDLEHTLDTLGFAQRCQNLGSPAWGGALEPSFDVFPATSSCDSSLLSAVNTSLVQQQTTPVRQSTTPVRLSTTPTTATATTANARPLPLLPHEIALNEALQAHEREIAQYRARALLAEKESAHMTLRLREEFAVLETHIDEITREADEARAQAREARALAFEAQQALADIEQALENSLHLSHNEHGDILIGNGEQEQREVEALAEHAAAFTIQSLWRRYERRLVQRRHAELTKWHQKEIATYVEENTMLKTYLGLYQEQEALCASLLRQVDEWKLKAETSARACEELKLQLERAAPAQDMAEQLAVQGQALDAARVELDLAIKGKDEVQAQLDSAQHQLDSAESSVRQLQAKLDLIEDEGQNHQDMEHSRLHAQISSLELQRDVAQQQTKEAQESVSSKLREVKREHSKREAEMQQQVDEKQRNVELLAGEIKQLYRAAEEARETHQRELKEAVAAASAAHQRRSVGESFMFHYKDSRISNGNTLAARTRLSAIPPHAAGGAGCSALMPANEDTQLVAATAAGQEEFLCVKVDVEDCDGKSFRPCLSTVSPADPDVRTYQVKAPLFDGRSGRWCRIRIKLLNSSSFPVHSAKGITLEHLLPRGRSILHQMEVVKTELSPNGSAIQCLTIQWNRSAEANCVQEHCHRAGGDNDDHSQLSSPPHSVLRGDGEDDDEPATTTTNTTTTTTRHSEHQDCFCFNRGDESGPMVLHAKFQTGERTIHWKFPLRFKSPGGSRFVPAPLKGFLLARRSHRAADENKFGYLNSSWFPIPSPQQQQTELVDCEPVSDSHRVIVFQGYLQKTQSHLHHHRVQRWFVFAPPFLLCYDSAEKAAEDFSKGRALPHAANRALQLDPLHTRLRVVPHKVAGVEQTEFEVSGEGKKWTLQAANEEDLSRWMGSLGNWLAHEQELDALHNPPPPSLLVGGALDFVPEEEYDENEYGDENEEKQDYSLSDEYSGMVTRTVISPHHHHL